MKLKPGPHVFDISGLVSTGLITRRKEGITLKAHPPRVDPKSPAQIACRNSFRHCGSLYRSLPPSTRSWLDRYSLPRPLTSSAVFVRDNRAAVQNQTLLSPAPFNPYVEQIASLLFSTPAAGDTEDGRILATWTDNSPAAFTKLQLLIRLPSENLFFLTFQPDSNLETFLITGLAFETLYDCYAYLLDPVDEICATSTGQLEVLSSAYEAPPLADYVGSGAGTAYANGDYFQHTVSDGVPNYKKPDGSSFLYRKSGPPARRWLVCNVLDAEPGDYGFPNSDATPYLGLYNVVGGDPPGVTIAEG